MFLYSSRRRHTRCALGTGVQTCALPISVVSNLVLMRRRARRARLDDREAAALLGFDLLQLGVLLFLTGGLLNPFAILIIAPVMVSATILSRGATIALTSLALVCITLLALYHEPLPWAIGIRSEEHTSELQ